MNGFVSSVVFSHWTHFYVYWFIRPADTEQTLQTFGWEEKRGLSVHSRTAVHWPTLRMKALENRHSHCYSNPFSQCLSVKAWQVHTPVYNGVGIKEVLLKKTEERKWWLSIFNDKQDDENATNYTFWPVSKFCHNSSHLQEWISPVNLATKLLTLFQQLSSEVHNNMTTN